MKTFAFVLALALAVPGAALAEGFSRVDQKDSFLSLVTDRSLTRLGIKLKVTPDGAIEGRAFGRKVTGDWAWKSGYFCRDLYVGGDDLGANCQMVEVRGNTMRFTSDKGRGIYADLRLK